jgi:hypothetical protein
MVGSVAANTVQQGVAAALVVKHGTPLGFWPALREKLSRRDDLQFS